MNKKEIKDIIIAWIVLSLFCWVYNNTLFSLGQNSIRIESALNKLYDTLQKPMEIPKVIYEYEKRAKGDRKAFSNP